LAIRVAVDVFALLLLVFGLRRLRRHLTPTAFRYAIYSTVSALVIYLATVIVGVRVATISLDLAYSALILSAAVTTRGKVERLVPVQDRREGADPREDRHLKSRQLLMALLVLLLYFLLEFLVFGTVFR